jgi:adhesin transport system outer membrane protein
MDAAAARDRSYIEQVAANEKVVDVYMDQFTVGRRTLLDVLDAQNGLFSSRANDLDAVYAGKFAVFRLLALEGKMLEALGVNVKEAGLK